VFALELLGEHKVRPYKKGMFDQELVALVAAGFSQVGHRLESLCYRFPVFAY